MPEAKRFNSITEIKRDEWNRCFAGELETYDYFLSLERSHIKGFTHCYYAIMEGETLLAGLPAFFTDYDLATTADGTIKKILASIKRLLPSLVTLKLACIGSTATESCPVAMHPSLTTEKKQEHFSQLLHFFKDDAQAHNTKLLAFKDLSKPSKALYGDILTAHRFHCVAGMPTAVSPINFTSIDDYLSRLSSATRKDMRRKLKKQRDIRIDYRRNVDDIIDDIYAMYLETKCRSDLQFEELTPDYFREVLACTGEGGLCCVYFAGDKLIGANIMLLNEERLLDKFFCMRTDEGHAYNLYFVSWFSNLQYCLDKGLKIYQSGQAGYETKLRLGSVLEENWMYFHHRNRFADRLLKLVSPLLAFDIPEVKLSDKPS